MEQITPVALKAWLDDTSRDKPLLLDVREPGEFDICHIDWATLLPMSTVPVRSGELKPDDDIVVICHHGGRSMQVAMFLEQRGFSRLYNLQGGVNAWSAQVDPAMPRY